MKKLNSNFTTPEQSKRLLELGVPADSADCFWFDERDIFFLKDELYSDEAKDGEWVRATDYLPCWSVGRLIEIYCFAAGIEYIKICISEIPQIEAMIKMIEIAVTVKTFDFSKLEE